ncbi:hydroxyphenylacetyl-CoA thioesterase PaaI [Nocardia sp. CA-151230]|uniref:hydroxyphenylacetyl-CoA thioesterase PaaI n=1 Tax=Nocardia sp. CA-151230 TaxID=3239982 RepID=UPI003D8C4941
MNELSGQDSTGAGFAHAMLDTDRASSECGIQLLANGPGSATLAMKITEDMLNGHAITHGGYVFLLADTAFAAACNGYGRPTVAAGGSITYLEPTTAGDELVAEAVERARYGRNGIYDVTVRRGDVVIAEFRGTSREIPAWS